MAEAARTWKDMIDFCQGLLVRKTGHDAAWWAGRARTEGFAGSDRELAAWMRDVHGVTGYAVYIVSWELFGHPDFMLRDADELLDGQYADRQSLRPVTEAILAWAHAHDGVAVQMRKTYVSLLSPRRKFAQVTAATKSAVDVTLRWDGPAAERMEPVKTRADDPFAWRVRLRSIEDVDDALFEVLEGALSRNS